MSDPLLLFATFGIGFGATFLFVATGGVGMITIPALVFLGLSPQTAIATDVFALFGGRLGGLVGLYRAGKVDVGLGLRLGAVTGVGAIAGAFALLRTPEQLMKQVLAVGLVLLLGLLLLKPRLGVEVTGEVSRRRRAAGFAAFLPIGVWSTLIGSGFLNMGSAVLLLVFRRTFLETAGVLTIVGLAVALVALVIFGSHGAIVWSMGLAMLAGKGAGGYFGARYAVKVGDRVVRVLFVIVVLASALRLLFA